MVRGAHGRPVRLLGCVSALTNPLEKGIDDVYLSTAVAPYRSKPSSDRSQAIRCRLARSVCCLFQVARNPVCIYGTPKRCV